MTTTIQPDVLFFLFDLPMSFYFTKKDDAKIVSLPVMSRYLTAPFSLKLATASNSLEKVRFQNIELG